MEDDDEGSDILEKILVILSKKKSLFTFGSAGKRRMLPEYSSTSRFGVAYPVRRDFPHLAPGTYNQDFNSMMYNMETKICSPKGYTLGARTAQFLPPPKDNGVPGPAAYQPITTEFQPPKPSYKPFGSSCPREMGVVLTGKDAPRQAFMPLECSNPFEESLVTS
ncbi:hypothetical protein SprV_0100302100 [Sparganum proliferum]